MIDISNQVISLEEANAALRCMRLCSLSPEESIETLDCLSERIRKVSTSKIVENIIENKLSGAQRKFVKEYWYSGKSTACIARENNVSQANVYKALSRANETIRTLMTPLIEYHTDLINISVEPILNSAMHICAARNSNSSEFCEKLKNLRVSQAIEPALLASVMKISEHELRGIESGKIVPSITNLMRYSAIFSTDIKIDFTDGRGFFECITV